MPGQASNAAMQDELITQDPGLDQNMIRTEVLVFVFVMFLAFTFIGHGRRNEMRKY